MITGKAKAVLNGIVSADAGIATVQHKTGNKHQLYFAVDITEGWGERRTTTRVMVDKVYEVGKADALANALKHGTAVTIIGVPRAEIYNNVATVVISAKRILLQGSNVNIAGTLTCFVTGSVFKAGIRTVSTAKGSKDVFSVTVKTVDGFGDTKIPLWIEAERWYDQGKADKVLEHSAKDTIVSFEGSLKASAYNGKARLKLMMDEYELLGKDDEPAGTEPATNTSATPPPPASSAAYSVDDDLPF